MYNLQDDNIKVVATSTDWEAKKMSYKIYFQILANVVAQWASH